MLQRFVLEVEAISFRMVIGKVVIKFMLATLICVFKGSESTSCTVSMICAPIFDGIVVNTVADRLGCAAKHQFSCISKKHGLHCAGNELIVG